MTVFLAAFAVILWTIASKFNVGNDAEQDWECAIAVAVLLPLVCLIFGGVSWSYSLLFAALLFPTNWLYFKLTGRTDGIMSFFFFSFIGLIICLLLPALGASWILDAL